MFSSLKSLVTTPLSWFAKSSDEPFESEDTPGKRKLVYNPANSYDNEGDRQDAPSANRVKRIRLGSPDSVVAQPRLTAYLDPPTPSIRASTLPRTHASKLTRPYALSNNTIPMPRPDTSRYSPLSFNPPPRPQVATVARTMSMDPPTARRTSVQEHSYLPPPISRDVSMEFAPSPSTQPANPPFRLRSSLTPQPGAPLYGPNPQRRARNPSEPPPLTALIEHPIFVKPPPVSQDQKRINDTSPSVTLGSLVDTQKSVSIYPFLAISFPLLISLINRVFPSIDPILPLSLVPRLPMVSARHCFFPTLCFEYSMFQVSVPPTPQSSPSSSSRDTVPLSSLPILDLPMSTFPNSSRRAKRLAPLSS